MKHAQRTRFGEIVAEFMMPVLRGGAHGRGKRPRPSAPPRVVIVCPGMPSMPTRAALLNFFAKKGFWCFAIRYRGTWESGGAFLKHAPDEDVRIVMNGLTRGFRNAFTGAHYKLRAPEFYLLGISFGGPAVLRSSRDPRVRKVVAISSVVDWRAGSSESLPWTERFTRQAFGDAYRFSHKDWAKLGKGNFYSPLAAVKKIDGAKVIMLHAKDDKVAPFVPAEKFAAKTGATLVTFRHGGHLSSSFVTKPVAWKKVHGFLH